MTAEPQPGNLLEKKKTSSSTFARVARFMAIRVLMLFITIVIGVYTTILIANMGGYVDEIMRNNIKETCEYACGCHDRQYQRFG